MESNTFNSKLTRWIIGIFTSLIICTDSSSHQRRLKPSKPSLSYVVTMQESQIQKQDICLRLVEKIYSARVFASTPPDINGLWTSHRCEIRSGPEYVLRKYTFQDNSTFEALQIYYADPDCASPLYGILAKGSFEIYDKSWTTPGATEVNYYLSTVHIIPYSEPIAKILSDDINKTCPGHVTSKWEPYERYKVYSYEETGIDEWGNYGGHEVDCARGMFFSLHEMQLLRLEERHIHKSVESLLYLGDVHTDKLMRREYRPASYQEPLKRPDSSGCAVCVALSSTDAFYPPSLPTRNYIPSEPITPGEWFSERCEAQATAMFLIRRLIILSDRRTYECYYYYYGDALCREPLFTLMTIGKYLMIGMSPRVRESYEYDFKILSLFITVEDLRIQQSLNNPYKKLSCGIPGTWKLGVTQNLTNSGGCPQFGITIPNTEYDIVMFEKEHHTKKLFFGAKHTDRTVLSSPRNRPTSFQAPLIKCDRPLHNFKPPVERKKYDYRRNSGHLTRSSDINYHISILFYLFLIFLYC